MRLCTSCAHDVSWGGFQREYDWALAEENAVEFENAESEREPIEVRLIVSASQQ